MPAANHLIIFWHATLLLYNNDDLYFNRKSVGGRYRIYKSGCTISVSKNSTDRVLQRIWWMVFYWCPWQTMTWSITWVSYSTASIFDIFVYYHVYGLYHQILPSESNKYGEYFHSLSACRPVFYFSDSNLFRISNFMSKVCAVCQLKREKKQATMYHIIMSQFTKPCLHQDFSQLFKSLSG